MKRYVKSSLNKDSYPDWSAYDKYQDVYDEYIPDHGQGDTFSEQLVTAVSNIVYVWEDSGMVYDNRWNGYLYDPVTSEDYVSSWANWIYRYGGLELGSILAKVFDIDEEKEYEDILRRLQKAAYRKDFLKEKESFRARGDIYRCNGPFCVKII